MAADSRVWRDIRLTPVQELHERLMKDVLARVRDLDLVLKGGSALAFTRGLNRHSTDLDFDANRGVEFSDRIEAAARTVGVNLGPVERRDWSDHQRFLADYPNPFGGKAGVLKVNVRFRDSPRAENIEVIDGIRTYRVTALFDQKLAAAASRIDPRNLFDLAFLMERYGTMLSDSQIRRAGDFTEDLDRLERRHKNRFERDDVLRNFSSVDEVVLRFRYAITDQRDLRWPHLQEQRVPIPTGVLGTIVVIQSRARGRSDHRTDPGYRNTGSYQGFRLARRNASRSHVRERDVDPDWSISR